MRREYATSLRRRDRSLSECCRVYRDSLRMATYPIQYWLYGVVDLCRMVDALFACVLQSVPRFLDDSCTKVWLLQPGA